MSLTAVSVEAYEENEGDNSYDNEDEGSHDNDEEDDDDEGRLCFEHDRFHLRQASEEVRRKWGKYARAEPEKRRQYSENILDLKFKMMTHVYGQCFYCVVEKGFENLEWDSFNEVMSHPLQVAKLAKLDRRADEAAGTPMFVPRKVCPEMKNLWELYQLCYEM